MGCDMNSSARLYVTALAFVVFAANAAPAQVISQPTPVPLVTADAETWYLNGEPITFAGNTYYPAGAQVAFNTNEMVRSGSHLGVPLYARTTDEPYSVVYVPLARGFVQPYQRRRTGDVAGTVGTAPPAGVAAAYSPAGATVTAPQAAGPPALTAGPPADAVGQPRAPIPATAASPEPLPAGTTAAAATVPAPVGTAGRTTTTSRPTRTRIGPRPEGLNAIFVEFRDRRWYGDGQPIPLDRSRMIEIGAIRGFPVFVDRSAPEQRIYVATASGGSLVAPYAERKR